MHTALRHPERVTIDEVARAFSISRHHLVKVVHWLGQNSYLTTHRGVGGGFTLAKAPDSVHLGELVRRGERSGQVIDCSRGESGPCRILPACRLKGVLAEAAEAFFAALDRYTLNDLVSSPTELKPLLGILNN